MNITISEEAESNIERLILFLYAVLRRPNKQNLIKTVERGYLATWPGLAVARIKKYVVGDIINAKGHIHLKRQVKHKSQGTKNNKVSKEALEDEGINPEQEENNTKTNQFYGKFIETGLCGTDNTGKFPVRSKRGNKYVFLLYDYDSNNIISRPVKNRTDEEFVRVHDEIIEELTARGLKPKIQRLDNEASKAYTDNITKHGMEYHLTPAQIHRRNIAERAIQTFKNHFITILAGTASNFPENEWDRLIPQAELTLNLIRSSRINSRLSAEEQMNGTFNYNKTPLAPQKIKVLAYEMPSHRTSWGEHEKKDGIWDQRNIIINATRFLSRAPEV